MANRYKQKAIRVFGQTAYRVQAHRLIAEKALGKPLPPDAVVHHVDGNRSNNANSNLVICQDQAYHMLLHARQRAYDATGDANSKRCGDCNRWILPNATHDCPRAGKKRPKGHLFLGRAMWDQHTPRSNRRAPELLDTAPVAFSDNAITLKKPE